MSLKSGISKKMIVVGTSFRRLGKNSFGVTHKGHPADPGARDLQNLDKTEHRGGGLNNSGRPKLKCFICVFLCFQPT